MKILCISDLHYVSKKGYEVDFGRKCSYGLEFLKRVLNREKEVDLIIGGGDFIDNVNISSSIEDFRKIKDELENTGIPFILVRGNHDIEEEKFFEIAENYTKPVILGDYIFYPFHDEYREDNTCFRKREELEKFEKFCKENSDKKVIAIQHYLIYPDLKLGYPFNIENENEILECYKKNRVFLSISGHYHPGLPMMVLENIHFAVVPAIVEKEFSYFVIELDDEIKIERKNLSVISSVPIFDFHCHTEFAYCGKDVNAEGNIERAFLLGLSGIVLTEHAGQLYLSSEDYWSGEFLEGLEVLKKGKEEKTARIREFKKSLFPLKNEFVRIGLEVECDKKGNITLLEEDRDGIDYLIGAVHIIPDEFMVSKEKMKEGFLKFTEFLCKNNIDILAHPLRFFRRNNAEVPEGVAKDVVKILKDYNVAAELNFHTNQPDPEFFSMCMEEGIKISLGSDAHNLGEVGEFSPHIEFLNNLKADLKEVLYFGK